MKKLSSEVTSGTAQAGAGWRRSAGGAIKAPKKRGKSNGKKQAELPGYERSSVVEIDSAAAAYVSARDERMVLAEVEADVRLKLEALMRSHGLQKYRYGDGETEYECYTTEPNVKVRKVRGEVAQAEAE